MSREESQETEEEQREGEKPGKGVWGQRHQWKRTVQDRGEAKQEEDQEMSVGASATGSHCNLN